MYVQRLDTTGTKRTYRCSLSHEQAHREDFNACPLCHDRYFYVKRLCVINITTCNITGGGSLIQLITTIVSTVANISRNNISSTLISLSDNATLLFPAITVNRTGDSCRVKLRLHCRDNHFSFNAS